MCIEYREALHIKSKIQVSKVVVIAKYGSLDMYDEDTGKIFIIDHEQLQFDKTDGWTLIGIPQKEDVTLSDHEYFCINDDIFDRIQPTHQDRNILQRFISDEPNEDESQSEATEIHNDKIQNKKRNSKNIQPSILFRERGKKQLTIGKIHLMTSD